MARASVTGARWRARPRLARALRVVAAGLPLLASIVVVRITGPWLPPAHGFGELVATWVVLCLIGTATMAVVDRGTRRLLPLAALLRVSLVFPDAAPSRFRTALRTGTVAQLERRVQDVRRNGIQGPPAEAAVELVELVAALNRHDRLTRGHAERVRAYARLIGEELKLDAGELDDLNWASLLHDIGKLVVPSEILNKPGALTAEEREIIERHPDAGARLVAPLAEWLGDWRLAVAEHHERWDGKGYPRGLAGHDISLAGRIVAVADVFDVLTSARSYKQPIPADEARKEIARCAGSQFDPTVVRAFLNVGIGRLRHLLGPLAWLPHLSVVQQLAITPIGAAVGGATASVVAATGAAVLPPMAAEPAAPPATTPAVVDAGSVPGRAGSSPGDEVVTVTDPTDADPAAEERQNGNDDGHGNDDDAGPPETTPSTVPEHRPETTPSTVPEGRPETTPSTVPEPEGRPESPPTTVPENRPESPPSTVPENRPTPTVPTPPTTPTPPTAPITPERGGPAGAPGRGSSGS
jgi:HD-GYP domain-containing protein (c-di-GMP phosphodiesterase class II)